jgi:hypothetical protein
MRNRVRDRARRPVSRKMVVDHSVLCDYDDTSAGLDGADLTCRSDQTMVICSGGAATSEGTHTENIVAEQRRLGD